MRKRKASASAYDAERAGDVPQVEDMDAFFSCRHGHDLTLSRCLSCIEEDAERLAMTEYDNIKEEGGL